MVELTHQNQELREINLRQHREGYAEGQAQNQKDRGGNAEPESQSRGTTSRKVPYLEK